MGHSGCEGGKSSFYKVDLLRASIVQIQTFNVKFPRLELRTRNILFFGLFDQCLVTEFRNMLNDLLSKYGRQEKIVTSYKEVK